MSGLNICVIGDSVGKGIVLNNKGRYRATELDLARLTGREDITIQNYSMFGCTITKALSLIERHAAELAKYDTVFIEIGGNDCDFDWQQIAENPQGEHDCKTPLEQFEAAYELLINTIRKYGGKPVILSLPPLDAKRYFSWITKTNCAKTILKWLGDKETIYRWQEMYNMRVVLLANKLSVPLIDIRSAFLKRREYRKLMCADGIHPNQKGHELIYRTIAEQYRKLSGFVHRNLPYSHIESATEVMNQE